MPDGEVEIAVRAEILHVDTRHLRRVPLDIVLGELHVAHLELRIVETHRRGQQAEDLGVGLGLAARLDRLLVDGEIEVPPGEHHVVVLSRHGGGEDDVGVSGRIGDEVLGRHEEQIFAAKPFDDGVGLRCLADGIGVVDVKPHDRRIELHGAGERAAELEIVDHARAGANEIGTRDPRPIHRELP